MTIICGLHKTKYILTMLIMFAVCFGMVQDSHPEEMLLSLRTPVDLVRERPGVSLVRYGSFGIGAYPYMSSRPGSGMKIFLDGVPLASSSPFCWDVELVPAVADSLDIDGRGIYFHTPGVETELPETTVRSLQGSLRRFTFDVAYRRKISEQSGILFSGSSNGIHGRDDILKNSMRNYYFKYRRMIEHGASVKFSVHGYRDRDGLVDLDTRGRMGQRKTDNMTISLGIHDYGIGSRSSVSPLIYYRDVNSRFDRYGLRKSLDDDAVGLRVDAVTTRGNTVYGLKASHETRMFDSRIHDDSWTRNETDVAGFLEWSGTGKRLEMSGGFLNSSKYGFGTNFDLDLALLQKNMFEYVLHAYMMNQSPEMGEEYYTALNFSDLSTVSDLEMSTDTGIEAGVRVLGSHVRYGVFVFASNSDAPVFYPSSSVFRSALTGSGFSTHSRNVENESKGVRLDSTIHFETVTSYDIVINYENRFSESGTNYLYPTQRCDANILMSRNVLKDNMRVQLTGKASYLHWKDNSVNPKGNHLLLDGGLNIKVSRLELFYRIENVTGQNISWFDTLGWRGRNTMWGVNWSFSD